MKFLVTNDDGYLATGLVKLVEHLKTLGEVVIVAPLSEKSAQSHAINIKDNFLVKNITPYLGCEAYAIDSTPADCVRYALYALNVRPDILISGINNGYNAGDDILYSGTVSAAMEGALRGIPSVALSIERGDIDKVSDEIKKTISLIFSEKLFSKWNCWNINIPINFREVKYTHQGDTHYHTCFLEGENTRQLGEPHFELEEDENSDVYNLVRNNLTIMAINYDRTKYFA